MGAWFPRGSSVVVLTPWCLTPVLSFFPAGQDPAAKSAPVAPIATSDIGRATVQIITS